MNPARFETFALAYTPALLQAMGPGKLPLGEHETREDYAVSVALTMLERIEKYGVESVHHYALNSQCGAFRETCKALGIENTTRSIENYLEGK